MDWTAFSRPLWIVGRRRISTSCAALSDINTASGGSSTASSANASTTAPLASNAAGTSSGSNPNSTTGSAYRRPRSPSGIPLSKLFSNLFPLSLTESYEQWRRRFQLGPALDTIMSKLSFYPEPSATASARFLQAPISKGNFINEFEIVSRQGADANKHVVLLHGYGAGMGFFYKNLEVLGQLPGWTTHALDFLGYGNSSRPDFKIHSSGPLDAVLEAEDFFIDSLEEWRISRGLDQFAVVAHSLGAYLTTSYAMKYPGRVTKIMMVSPAGVATNPYEIVSNDPNHKPQVNDQIPGWFHYLWERNVSPFTLVRSTGPLGPRFVSGWTSRRFANLTPADAQALHFYTYCIFNAKGSGEYALNHLLAPGANARRPLIRRVHKIPCPTYWIYGDHDWMDVSAGAKACALINQAHPSFRASVHLVKQSGHHLYLDNPTDFNAHMTDFLLTR